MPKIQSITCHKIVNSRGDWTIKTKVTLTDGSEGAMAVPDGASKGENEAVYIPVEKAVQIVSGPINDALIDENPFEQEVLDNLLLEMDGTDNERRLGGNSILSVSLAIAKASAESKGLELYEYLAYLYDGKSLGKDKNTLKFPTPVFNILNGGKHAHNGLSFQEFVLIPAGKFRFDKAMEIGVSVYHQLKDLLIKEGCEIGVGDEGGFAPGGFTTRKALDFIKKAASEKYEVGKDVFLGMDVAAESFHELTKYSIAEESLRLTTEELLEYHANILKDYEVIYYEDPFYEKDIVGWKLLNEEFGKKLMIIADDLVVTNYRFLKGAISKKLANAVIVKPNQVGTLTETFRFIQAAKAADMHIIVSHRSGDTAEDTFIADLALAVGADFIKSGAPVRGERVAKYNRLLEVFDEVKTT